MNVPTLEEIAIRKIVMLLYNDPEIKQQAQVCTDFDPALNFNPIVRSKILNFSLPTDLNNKLLPIASRFCLWLGQLYAMHDIVSSIFGISCQCLQGILEGNYLSTPNGFFCEREIVEKLMVDARVDIAFCLVLSVAFQGEKVALPYFLMMTGPMKLIILENDVISKLKLLNIAFKEVHEPVDYVELFLLWNKMLDHILAPIKPN